MSMMKKMFIILLIFISMNVLVPSVFANEAEWETNRINAVFDLVESSFDTWYIIGAGGWLQERDLSGNLIKEVHFEGSKLTGFSLSPLGDYYTVLAGNRLSQYDSKHNRIWQKFIVVDAGSGEGYRIVSGDHYSVVGGDIGGQPHIFILDFGGDIFEYYLTSAKFADARFSGDGRTMMIAAGDIARIDEGGRVLMTYEAPYITHRDFIAFPPNMREIIWSDPRTGEIKNNVLGSNAEKLTEKWKYRVGSTPVISYDHENILIKATPDCNYIVGAYQDNSIRVIDQRGDLVWKTDLSSAISDLDITDDGSYVLVSTLDKISVFDKNGAEIGSIQTAGRAMPVRISSDGASFVYYADNKVYGQTVASLKTPTPPSATLNIESAPESVTPIEEPTLIETQPEQSSVADPTPSQQTPLSPVIAITSVLSLALLMRSARRIP
ncbi:YncE family protein [Methanocalculus chunghsingensis]|nr:DUF5711 family protein [Methanocalculus chunghsingensis]